MSSKIKDFNDWKGEMIGLADKALEEDRELNAAWYYRAAEFFVSPDDPDKEKLYDKFIELFYTVYEGSRRSENRNPI